MASGTNPRSGSEPIARASVHSVCADTTSVVSILTNDVLHAVPQADCRPTPRRNKLSPLSAPSSKDDSAVGSNLNFGAPAVEIPQPAPRLGPEAGPRGAPSLGDNKPPHEYKVESPLSDAAGVDMA